MSTTKKKIYAYLLSGNSGLDLLDMLWPHLPTALIEQLSVEMAMAEKDLECDYLQVYNNCADYELNIKEIWS